MKPQTFLQSQPLALCSAEDGAAVPEWVQLTPPGPQLAGRDGRVWAMPDALAVARAYGAQAAEGIEAPVDFEHATHFKGEAGERADACGWLKEVEVRDGALWGRIDWLEAGQQALASRGYRYISPGFRFDPKTRAVARLVSVGLTNIPNFVMPALNRAGASQESEMDAAVLEALGLAATAGPAEAVLAINRLKSSEQTALNRAQTPDPEEWVPRADHDLALNRISGFEAGEKVRAEAEAEAAVDAAIAAQKISPATRDYHLATCRAEGGLERFRKFAELQPAMLQPSGLDQKKPGGTAPYSEEQLAVCRQLDMDPAEVFGAGKQE